jgi:hypothetical protein
MRTFLLLFFLGLFLLSTYLNCTFYGSLAELPHSGIVVTEYAEKERDIFLKMYIARGTLLPSPAALKDISVSLARGSSIKALAPAQPAAETVPPAATGKSLGLGTAFISILYWLSPITGALFLLIFLLPIPREEEN